MATASAATNTRRAVPLYWRMPSSVADACRAETRRELAARSSSARVGLAHALCEAGLDLLMAGQGLTKHEAARRLRRRQHGRRPSMLNDTEAA